MFLLFCLVVLAGLFNAWEGFREGENVQLIGGLGTAAGFVFLMLYVYSLPSGRSPLGDDCYTDWDGRSNQVVCD